jgi:hypothetical protein
MDDIWGGYYLQTVFPDSIIYNQATVYQERNQQDLIINLEKELTGYRHTSKFIQANCSVNEQYIPKETKHFFDVYRSLYQ